VTRLPPRLLIAAYGQGAFPMGDGASIDWYSPDPRAVIPLETFCIPRTLRSALRRPGWQTRVNTAFTETIRACADRPDGTWITPPIIRAYEDLHELGWAHSVEVWRDDALIGGLYGVAVGGAFFGESMFHRQRDASKVALVRLVERLRERGFALLDIQFTTHHLRRFGAVEIPRSAYLQRLAGAVAASCRFA